MFLLCASGAFFLVNVWALDPLEVIVFLKGIGVDFASTFLECSLALLEVGCVVFGANDGDEDNEGGYDTNEDTFDLMLREFEKI